MAFTGFERDCDTVVALAAGAPVTVIGRAEPAPDRDHVRVAPAARSRLRMGGAPGCLAELDVAAPDRAFAAALISALVLPEGFAAAAAPASLALNALAERVASRPVTVLIQGPTGTGKEVLARRIHLSSPRRDASFVAVNCAALPEAMLEALLFGHERGAFTGAQAASKGLMRAANGGTLLLDEIAELPLGSQAKLLRALQEREVLAIGATVASPVDVRVIATANRDLVTEVAAGRFRADLYYRLAVFPLATTALKQRPEDLLPIVAALLLRLAGGAPPWPTPGALAALAAHDWPGNVRELANVLERALIYAEGGQITARDIVLDSAPPGSAPAVPLGLQVREQEHEAIRRVLNACAGRRGDTARQLGISERTLRYKLAAMAGGGERATLQ